MAKNYNNDTTDDEDLDHNDINEHSINSNNKDFKDIYCFMPEQIKIYLSNYQKQWLQN